MTAFSRHKVLESWLIACLVLGKQKYTRTVQVSGSPCVWTPPLGVTLTIIYIYHFVMLFPSTQLAVYGVQVKYMFSDSILNILNDMMFVLFTLYVVCMFIVAYYCYCCIVYMFILLLITDVVYYYRRYCCLCVQKLDLLIKPLLILGVTLQ